MTRAGGRGEARATPSLLTSPPVALLVVLVAVRVIVLFAAIRAAHQPGFANDDAQRFEQIAVSEGRPWRDHPVEYMPLELIVVRTLGGDGLAATASRVAVLSLLVDLATAGALAYGWGRGGAGVYLVVGLPLLTFMSYRLDLLPVAIAAWAMALAHRDRDGPAGLGLAVAVLTKLWPLVLAPAFALRRRWRALTVFGCLTTGALVAWVGYGGIRAPWQVVSFRNATGWEVESTVGSILWLVRGGPLRFDAGALRIGTSPVWARGLLLAAIVVLVAWIWWRAEPDREDPAGGPSLAAVTALVGLSPLFSLQYTAWLLPWAAVAALGLSRERRVAGLATGIILLGGILGVLYGRTSGAVLDTIRILLLARNGACLALVVVWLWPRRDAVSAADPAPITP